MIGYLLGYLSGSNENVSSIKFDNSPLDVLGIVVFAVILLVIVIILSSFLCRRNNAGTTQDTPRSELPKSRM